MVGGKIVHEDVRERIAEVKATQSKRRTKAKTGAAGDAKEVDYETPSESVVIENETSPATIREPAAQVAEALLNLLDVAERQRLCCTPNDVAVFLMDEENKRIPLANRECFGFITSVTEALLRMPEPHLKLVS